MPRIKAIIRNLKSRLSITRKKDGKRTGKGKGKERCQAGEGEMVVSDGGEMRKPDEEEEVVEGNLKDRGTEGEEMGRVVESGRYYSKEGTEVAQPQAGLRDEDIWGLREDDREGLRYGDDMPLSSAWAQGESRRSATEDGRKSYKSEPAEKKRRVLLGRCRCRAEEEEVSGTEEEETIENVGSFRVESVGNREQYMVELSQRPYPSISADILVIRVPNANQRVMSEINADQSTEGAHTPPERVMAEQYLKEETNASKEGVFHRERFSLTMISSLWSSEKILKAPKALARITTRLRSRKLMKKKRKDELAEARLAASLQRHSEREDERKLEELELGRISSENVLFTGNNVSSGVAMPLSLPVSDEKRFVSGGRDSQLVQCPEKHQGEVWQMGWMIGELGSSQRDPYWLLQDDVTPYVRRFDNSDNEVLGGHGDTVPLQRCIRRVRGCENLASMM
ncbi:hypothetical protein EX30DRAFT_349180 [Ascodesmis nigricans]|uniref:Uncharacterized protein n=1 Tax=Ascodesmis nigricans TaxID=341454 RepID=A0A4S2MVN5_9PEZI|nr:hypothetical protein EX30DRAFT_349180 [Ascodesmis nigricans]